MKAGDLAIWLPVVLSGVPRRVVINRLGEMFCSVSVVAGDVNPNANPSYTARTEELHRIERKTSD